MTAYSRFALVLPAVCIMGIPSAPLRAQAEIDPPQVHQLATIIMEELEVIRWHMGRPLEARPFIPVEEVAIRENFRGAMILWNKVNQLGEELVGGGEAPPVVPTPPGGEYGPPQVHQVLTGVLARIQEIRDGTEIVGASGIAGESTVPAIDLSATPSDVFQLIVQSNRQVNSMLERRAQPGDVYQQVQQATFYASEILAATGDPTPFPAMTEAMIPGMTAGHVYGRVLEVFDRLSGAFDALGLEMVHWAGGAYLVDETISPSDVIDLGTLLLSDLEYLHSRVPNARAPIMAAHPGTRWPSDVYRLVGLLHDQVTRILLQAQNNPDAFHDSKPND